MGPGVANECAETKDGPTIWEDHFYPEIIDPDTGEVLPDGEFGELVFTSLTKEAMPVVRYRTRDLTRLLPGTARAAFRRMEKITGRTDDMMIVRGVNVFPSQIEELILKHAELAPHYQCVLGKEGPMDTLTVRVECAHRRRARGGAARPVGAGPRHQGVYRRDAPPSRSCPKAAWRRSVGKARRIVDQRPRWPEVEGCRAAAPGISTHIRPPCFMRPAVSPAASPAPQKKSARTPPLMAEPVSCANIQALDRFSRERPGGREEHRHAQRNRGRIDGNRPLGGQRHAQRADRAVVVRRRSSRKKT